MAKRTPDIEALVQSLSELQKDVEVERLLGDAFAEPLSTEDKLRYAGQVLAIFRDLGLVGRDEPGELHILLALGRTFERLLHLEKAYETYQEAYALAERLDDGEARANLLCRMGRVLSRWSRWDEAMGHLDRSLEAYRALGSEGGQARVLLNRGIVYHERGSYDEATRTYEEALELAKRVGEKDVVANATNNLAVLATIRGDLDGAVERYERSLEMFEEAGNTRGLARTHQNLGMVHADRQDWKAAMTSYDQGLNTAEKNQQLDVVANIHLARAELLLELEDTSLVALCCAHALDICRQTGDRLGEADAYRLLGRLFTLRKQWNTAACLFRDSLRLNEEFANPLDIAETHRDIGRMHAARGQTTDARTSYEAALAGFRKLGANKDAEVVEGLLASLG